MDIDQNEVKAAKRAMTQAFAVYASARRSMPAEAIVGIMNESILQMAAESLVLKILPYSKNQDSMHKSLTDELHQIGANAVKYFNQAVRTAKETQSGKEDAQGNSGSKPASV